MAGKTLLRTFFAAAGLAFLASCAEYPTKPTAVAPSPTPMGYWNGDGVPGSPKIIVSISEQHAYFFKGKNLVGETTVSTGKPGFGTPPGQYTVLSKDAAHVSTVFGDYVDDMGNVVKSNIDSRKDSRPPGSHYDGARMPFAMFFRGGYAMHQGYVPPYAASHGCIRVPQGMAETFFNNATVGTPVIVKQEAVMRTTMVPASLAVPPPSPYVVQSPAPAPVRPVAVHTTATPAPIPLRSPAAVMTRPSAPLRSPGPTALHTPTPAPVLRRTTNAVPTPSPIPPLRAPSPAPVRTTSVRSTVPVPAPTPVRSPAPVLRRNSVAVPTPTPLPLRSPTPVPLRSRTSVPTHSPTPAPLQTVPPFSLHTPPPTSVRPGPAPVVSPTPAPTRSNAKKRVHSRHHRRSQAPAPTPTPAP